MPEMGLFGLEGGVALTLPSLPLSVGARVFDPQHVFEQLQRGFERTTHSDLTRI